MTTSPWRHASTLILCASEHLFPPAVVLSTPTTTLFNYRTLFLKRSQKSTFFPNALVFPGGGTSDVDWNIDWDPVLPPKYFLQSILHPHSRRLPIYKDAIPKNKEHHLPGEVALRLCALRETFEECGLLLMQGERGDRDIVVLSDHHEETSDWHKTGEAPLAQWRERVCQQPDLFLDLCRIMMQKQNLRPAVNILHEWSDWLTPLLVRGKKRYDTVFYLATLAPLEQPCGNTRCWSLPLSGELQAQSEEVMETTWRDPAQSLASYLQRTFELAPPQVYEMARVYRFRQLEALQEFAKSRATLGCDVIMPVMQKLREDVAEDQISLFTLPGDLRHPIDVQYNKWHESWSLPPEKRLSKAEVDQDQWRHRMIRAAPRLSWPDCTIHIRGHTSPVNWQHFCDVEKVEVAKA